MALSYCVELGEWRSVFAVPSSVVDNHIKLVGSSQLKVLLWILRNADREFSEEEIASVISVHKEDVKDAINYWAETGILKFGALSFTEKKIGDSDKFESKCEEKEKIKKSNFRTVSRTVKPDGSYIIERIKGCEEIAFLMQEAQIILGRPISTGDSAVLLTLLDNEGLPIDVILMIMQYAVGIGKGNMRYIEAVGISWAKEEIDTIEKAEKKIKSLSQARKAWKKFEQIIGSSRQPSSKEEEAVNRWYNIWGINSDIVREAYEICINSNGKYVLKYIDSIISRWRKDGILTLDQIRSGKDVSDKKTKNFSKKPSYNIDEYEKYNIFDEIKLGMNYK